METDKTPPEDPKTTRAAEPADGSARRIDNYRILQKIAEGGMDTKQVVARFEAERQALATMDHSGVAKVFDASPSRTLHWR